MKKGRITPIIASAVSLSMLTCMTFPVSAVQEIKVVEETEDTITYYDVAENEYLTMRADDHCYYWEQTETSYYAVTLEEGTAVPEEWNVIEPELNWAADEESGELISNSPYRGQEILPWGKGVFDYFEFDENTIVVTDVTDAASLYQTEGVTDVYAMCAIKTRENSFLWGDEAFVVFPEPDTILTLEDFSSIPEVTAVEEKTSECLYYCVRLDLGLEEPPVTGSRDEYNAAKIESLFRLSKELQKIDGVSCAVLSFSMQDYIRPVTTTYTLTRVADPDAYGDIDNDGTVNADDAYRALAYYAEQSVGKEDAKLTAPDADKFAEAAAFCAGDVNGDGVVNGDDAYTILCYYAAASVGDAPDWSSIF
ncbi:MAG: hypothetical protein ACI4XB_03125 [Ruminococcus sp.]